MILPKSVTFADFYDAMTPKIPSYFPWRVLSKVMTNGGLPLKPKEEALFEQVSGGRIYRPGGMPPDSLVLKGRRGGGTLFCMVFGVYQAATFDGPLPANGQADVLVVTPSYRSSETNISYADALLNKLAQGIKVPLSDIVLRRRKSETAAELTLANGTCIKTTPVGPVTGRSGSTLLLIMDEAAHFRIEGRFSDQQLFESARPSMANLAPHSSFLICTSPLTKEGLVYDLWRRYYGKNSDELLVIQGSSKTFNPSLSDEFLAQELEVMGESYFAREYRAEFQDASASAYAAESIESCVIPGRTELPYQQGTSYVGGIDPAGLSPNTQYADDWVSGVGHVKDGIVVMDALRSWTADREARRRSDPDTALAETVELFKRYHVRKIIGDRYSGAWIEPRLKAAGFEFVYAGMNKSDAFLELVPAINSQRVELLDHPELISQLKSLERKRGGGNKDKIEHPKGHGRRDDLANVGALLALALNQSMVTRTFRLSDVRIGGTRTSQYQGETVSSDIFRGIL